MQKKYLIPLIWAFLSLAFLSICILIFFTGNRYKRLTAIKFFLGGLIISLSSSLESCVSMSATCYKGLPRYSEKEIDLATELGGFQEDKILLANRAGVTYFNRRSKPGFFFGPEIKYNYNYSNGLYAGADFGIDYRKGTGQNVFARLDAHNCLKYSDWNNRITGAMLGYSYKLPIRGYFHYKVKAYTHYEIVFDKFDATEKNLFIGASLAILFRL